MRKTFCLLCLFFIMALTAGCGPRQLAPGAENVNLYTYTPKSCRFLGSITNSNVHGDMDLLSSPQDLQKDDRNFLKNEGARLGANVVVLVSHKTIETKRKAGPKNPSYITFHEHAVNANAYICSPEIMHKLKQGKLSNYKIYETPLT